MENMVYSHSWASFYIANLMTPLTHNSHRSSFLFHFPKQTFQNKTSNNHVYTHVKVGTCFSWVSELEIKFPGIRANYKQDNAHIGKLIQLRIQTCTPYTKKFLQYISCIKLLWCLVFVSQTTNEILSSAKI